jgi:putative FmdB family regulatory protein
MPFYEYECSSCKFYTELLQKVSAAPLRKCPSCGRSTMKKLVSAPNFRLKGGGWYETDFKSDKENQRNLAVEKDTEVKAPEPKPDATKAADAKPDPKPAEPKPESKPAEPSKRRKKTAPRKSPVKSRSKPARRARR